MKNLESIISNNKFDKISFDPLSIIGGTKTGHGRHQTGPTYMKADPTGGIIYITPYLEYSSDEIINGRNCYYGSYECDEYIYVNN